MWRSDPRFSHLYVQFSSFLERRWKNESVKIDFILHKKGISSFINLQLSKAEETHKNNQEEGYERQICWIHRQKREEGAEGYARRHVKEMIRRKYPKGSHDPVFFDPSVGTGSMRSLWMLPLVADNYPWENKIKAPSFFSFSLSLLSTSSIYFKLSVEGGDFNIKRAT